MFGPRSCRNPLTMCHASEHLRARYCLHPETQGSVHDTLNALSTKSCLQALRRTSHCNFYRVFNYAVKKNREPTVSIRIVTSIFIVISLIL